MAYAFKSTLTVDHTQCGSSSSTSFPVLLLGTFAGVAGAPDLRVTGSGGTIQNTVSFNGQTVPADLKFTSDAAGTTLLNWEVAQYTATTGAIEVHIQITISNTVDTNIYMFFGDTTVTTYQGGSVGAAWDANFKNVYHLADGTTLSLLDSTSNAATFTNTGTTPATTGQIDGAASFNGTTQYLLNATKPTLNPDSDSFTISFWNHINTADVQVSAAFEFGNGTGIASNRIQAHVPWVDKTLYWDAGDSTGNAGRLSTDYTAYLDAWTYVSLQYNASTGLHSIYLNNSLVISNTHINSGHVALSGLIIGAGNESGINNFVKGLQDEFRVSNSARGTSWALAEYNNQKTSSNFLTVGAQTVVSSFIGWTMAFK